LVHHLTQLVVGHLVEGLRLLLFGWLAARKKYAECVPLALAGGYYLTLFLGPAVQLRYLYPLMIVLPFAAAVCLRPHSGESSDSDMELTRQRAGMAKK
ncbi:MAG: hypothetical protein K2O57_06545, partial [Acetatifactor sp.]|nr:hypothetical protein [Acetatifactor sp.]